MAAGAARHPFSSRYSVLLERRRELMGSVRVRVLGACSAVALLVPDLASAQDDDTGPRAVEQAEDDGDPNAATLDPLLSLDPTAPNVGALPGGITPAYGQKSGGVGDWRFDFHGLFTMPLVAGINKREDPDEGESSTVLHAPPVVPEDLETFSHTGVTPTPYAQLNFSYGNNVVTGNVQLLARQATVSTGFFDPPSQAGINDAFLNVRPDVGSSARLSINVGAFTNRYGVPGEFDEGRYGTPLIMRTNGVGENILATIAIGGGVSLLLEHGFQGESNKAPPDLTPDLWNDFADPNVGASFVHHVHAGVNYQRLVTFGAHYVNAFSQDDRATGTLAPDGSIDILAGDVRLTMGRFGHLYFAVSHVDADAAATVGQIISVLNTRGGPGLMQNYLGEQSNGNGSLLVFGGQYDLSIGRLVSYPVPFYGDGPDIVVSAFGMGVQVESDDEAEDGVMKRKFGGEATYSLLSWFAPSIRYDRVDPNLDQQRESFAIVSPRLIFRTDWQSTDQIVLQYSHWFNGSLTTVRTGAPPVEDPTVVPDEDVISLSASMWW